MSSIVASSIWKLVFFEAAAGAAAAGWAASAPSTNISTSADRFLTTTPRSIRVPDGTHGRR